MTGKRYRQLLMQQLPDYMAQHGCDVFMHDGAPCHRANIVKNWLQGRGITTMEWPGNSPDLNPIENAWHVMKNKVFRNGYNMSIPQLRETIRHVWDNELDLPYFKALSDSMSSRCKAVIKAKGYMTKY